MASDSSSQKLSLTEKIGYSLGDLAANFVFQMQIMYLSYFYTEVFGIAAATMGTLLLITRMWHAVIDPMMGAIADRTNTRWGKFRPWVLWTAVPFGLLFVLTYTTPDLDPKGKVVWAYATYILLMLVYTINNIPYSAMTGVLTGDSIERTSLAQWRFIAAISRDSSSICAAIRAYSSAGSRCPRSIPRNAAATAPACRRPRVPPPEYRNPARARGGESTEASRCRARPYSRVLRGAGCGGVLGVGRLPRGAGRGDLREGPLRALRLDPARGDV